MKIDHFVMHLEAYGVCVRRESQKSRDYSDGTTHSGVEYLFCLCSKLDRKPGISDLFLTFIQNGEIKTDTVCMICKHYGIDLPANLKAEAEEFTKLQEKIHKDIDTLDL